LLWLSRLLVLIGALNWGLIGFFNFNLVAALFGTGYAARVIYAVIGIAAVFGLFSLGAAPRTPVRTDGED
jgi:uncharacterized membrane protein YuzA (DUF378 family)